MAYASVAAQNLRRSAGLVRQPTVVCVRKADVAVLPIAQPAQQCSAVISLAVSAVHKLVGQAAELYVIMVQVQLLAVLKRLVVTSIALAGLVA